jgi:transcriptional regulatory protein LevR
MAQLFGVVKGAYTGADHDREGLVEQAHRGILFLDEVHRLPPEGQEMLFYLMDRERFRRLGDPKERQSSLLLLAATTEDPQTALLPTFRRRIPMTITLPGLHERTISERYALVRTFFTNECSSIGTHIHVAPQVLRAFLLYECPGNIGQLRSDVQLTCARAYLEFRTQQQHEMHVHLDVLPEHVRRGLLRTADLHRTLDPVAHELEATHIFTPMGLQFDSYPGSAHDLYENINTELVALRDSDLKPDEINELLHLDIQHYFQSFADAVVLEAEKKTHLIERDIEEISEKIVQMAQEQLGREFPDRLNLVLALHLTSALEHIKHQRPLLEPELQSLRHTYPKEYVVAQTALLHIRAQLGIALPESEVNMLTILLANVDMLLSPERATVGIVVAAHGRGIAAGLADLANTLVGTTMVHAVELTLEQSPKELLAKVEQSVKRADQGSGVLLLVDFASLLSLGELVTQHLGIQARAVSGVCAPLIVEAVRQAQGTRHVTVEQLATYLSHFRVSDVPDKAIMKVGEPAHQARKENATQLNGASSEQKRVILSLCLTGFGSATKMAELIEDRLPYLDKRGVEIICVDINLSGKTEADIQRLVDNRDVVAIVGTINPHLESYPFVSLTDLLFGDGITRLHTLLGGTLIDPAFIQPDATHTVVNSEPPTFTRRADLIREISATLSQRMLFLNPARIVPLIENMIELIEVEVGETFDIEVLAGLILHLALILDRNTQQRTLHVTEQIRSRVEQQFARELSICRHAWQILSSQVGRSLPDEEAYNIVGILRQVDIFMLSAS